MASSAIPETMLAVQVVEYGKDYQQNRIPVPLHDMNEHSLLLKTAVASYCHTDQMVMDGVFGTKLPLVGSHEGAGTVVAVGEAVENFAIGDRVMAHVKRNHCGTCSDCIGDDKWRYYCRAPRDSLGITGDGAFAQYFLADSRWSVKLPSSISFATAAPLACAGATSFRAVKMTGLHPGEWLAIVGSGGGLGHLCTRFAKHKGLKVIGLDVRDEGLALSREAGADAVIDARNKDVTEQVKRLTGDDGAHATINLSEAPSAAEMACAVTRIHGTMWQIAQLVLRDIRIQGSVICSPKDAEAMIVAVDEMGGDIVETVPFDGLESIPDLVKTVRAGKIKGKAIVIVDRSQLDR